LKTRIALLPFDAREGDRAGNLERVSRAAADAAAAGARILVVPEMWSCGYDLAAARAEGERPGGSWCREIAAVAELSREHSIAIIGSMMEPPATPGGLPSNCAFIHDGGELLSRYAKVHLFGPLDEDRYVAPGETLPAAVEVGGLRVATAICYDLRFPELFRPASLGGVDLWCVPAQWPESRIGQWRALLVARAIENQCFVAGGNRRGRMGEILFGGHALLVGPTGEILLDSADRQDLLIGDFDREVARSLRESFPVLGDRRPDLY